MRLSSIIDIALIAFIAFPAPVVAESAATRHLREVLRSMETISTFGLEVETAVYLNKRDETPWVTYAATLYKKDRLFRRELGNTTQIITQEASIIVDSAAKSILYAPKVDSGMSTSSSLQEHINTEWEQQLDKFQLVGGSNDGVHYYLKLNRSGISSVDLFIDPERSLIRKIIYQYEVNSEKQPDHAVLIYKWKSKAHIADSHFDISKYVQEENGIYRTSRQYSGYKLTIQK